MQSSEKDGAKMSVHEGRSTHPIMERPPVNLGIRTKDFNCSSLMTAFSDPQIETRVDVIYDIEQALAER